MQDAHLPEQQAERVRRATAGHYGGDGGTNWGAVAGAGILGALLGAAAAPQQQPQIIVVVPPQPIYAAPQPVPGISEREFLEHYNPTPPPSQRIWPTYVSPVPSQRIWWCPASRRWYPDVGDFDSSYYLHPDGPIAVETLRVIGAAMAEAGVVGLGRLTLSRRERMVMVEPSGIGMALFTGT